MTEICCDCLVCGQEEEPVVSSPVQACTLGVGYFYYCYDGQAVELAWRGVGLKWELEGDQEVVLNDQEAVVC